MEQNELDWRRLGEMVREARIRRGYRTQRALAETMGVSSKLINNIELGKNTSYSPTSLIGLEMALGWGRGSVERVLSGDDPFEAEPAAQYDWQRLAQHVRLRREEGGVSLADVTARGGPDEEVLAQIEAGRAVRDPRTLSDLDRALNWFQGSSLRVLEGREPSPQPGPPPLALSPAEATWRKARRRAPWSPPPDVESGLLLENEELFEEWSTLFLRSLALEMEYARRRGFTQPAQAREELVETLFMAAQVKDGRPWVPPWEEISDDEAQDQIDALRETGLNDEHGEPIEDDEPPHPIPEPEFDDDYLRDLGAAAREGDSPDDQEPDSSDPHGGVRETT